VPSDPDLSEQQPYQPLKMSLDKVREYLKAEPFNSVYYDGEYKKPYEPAVPRLRSLALALCPGLARLLTAL
jgi:hypothetical protein